MFGGSTDAAAVLNQQHSGHVASVGEDAGLTCDFEVENIESIRQDDNGVTGGDLDGQSILLVDAGNWPVALIEHQGHLL